MEPFKNLFNKKIAFRISTAIKKHWIDFDNDEFLKDIDENLLPLELKERVNLITLRLHLYLPQNKSQAISILVKTLKHSEHNPLGLHHFEVWPLTHYIALYGLDHFDQSMDALKEMTKVFTSEFAVRPFFIKDESRTLKYMKNCLLDENEHVRRWATEGSRPLLPWGQKLHRFALNPNATWGILEKLKNDSSLYVRKSIANHINDHSKNHPDFVIEKLLKWHHQKNKTDELTWIIKHASRSLIKKGFKKAFLLHGVEDDNVKLVRQKILNRKVKIGESLTIEVMLENYSSKSSLVIMDNEIHFLRANGEHKIKVFKGKKLFFKPKEKQIIEMKIPLKLVTTRVYYSGEHFWNIKINGMSSKPTSFYLYHSQFAKNI